MGDNTLHTCMVIKHTIKAYKRLTTFVHEETSVNCFTHREGILETAVHTANMKCTTKSSISLRNGDQDIEGVNPAFDDEGFTHDR